MAAWSPSDPVQSMGMPEGDATVIFDKVFGPGKWRFTGKYRTQAREDELRSEGAETVPEGHVSPHSEGTPDAPGAYDINVDGLSPAEAAEKLDASGHKFSKLFPEGASGSQGGHLHVQPILEAHEWTPDDPVIHDAGEGDPAAPPPPTTAPKASPPQPDRHSVRRGGQEAMAGVRDAVSDIKTAYTPGPEEQYTPVPRDAPPQDKILDWWANLGGPPQHAPGGERAAAADRVPTIPLTAANNALKGFLHGTLGIDPNDVDATEAAAMYLIGGPKAGAANLPARATGRAVSTVAEAATPNALKASTQTLRAAPHTQDVKLLHENGVRMSPGQIQGGPARELESKRSSDPLQGPAIHERVNQSMEDFNRSMYRRSLKLIGEDYPANGPVGEEAVDKLFQAGEQRYEALKPKIKLQETDGLKTEIKRALDDIGPSALAERADLKHIIDTRVTPAFRDGQMDGQAFKNVESHLTTEMKRLRNGSPYQQREAEAIDDVLGALRTNAEDHSPPGVGEELKKLNSFWASINRISDAAYSAKAQGGRFTPNQMLTAAGKGGRMQRRMVSRGKAFDQDFISAAQRVLPNKVPDSGTAGRMLANRGHARSIGAALGGAAGAGLGLHAGGIPGVVEGGGIGSILGGMAGGAVDRAIAPTANSLARARLETLAQKQLARRGIAQPRQQPNMLRQAVRPPIQQGPTP